jgi:hypothetical protein
MSGKRKLVLVLLSVAVLASVVGAAVASYVMTSNVVSLTVTDPERLTLAGSHQTIVSGQTYTLTATISDQRNGVVVTFYDGDQSIGQASSMGGGLATLTIEPSMGNHNYHAVASHP